MYLYIIFSSLISSLWIGLFGKYIGRQAAIYSALVTLLVSFFFAVIILLMDMYILFCHHVILYNLFIINDIKLDIGFLFDQLTAIMLFVVLGISSLVHIFTAGYMSHDPFIVRFYTFLGLFTFFMIILVTADNFLQLFVGWEGVGVCSYLLINFWYTRIVANKAAIKAMLMNRIADVFFIFAIILLLYYFKTLNYILIFSLADYIENDPPKTNTARLALLQKIAEEWKFIRSSWACRRIRTLEWFDELTTSGWKIFLIKC